MDRQTRQRIAALLDRAATSVRDLGRHLGEMSVALGAGGDAPDSPPDAGDPPAPDVTPPSVRPGEPADTLPLGVVFGVETSDHADDVFGSIAVPRDVRYYYLMDKDEPANPSIQPVGLNRRDSSLPYQATYGNYDRLRKLHSLGIRNPLISTEAYIPGGHWTWKYLSLDTFTEHHVSNWVARFVHNVNAVFGVGGWKWQMASEPWDKDKWPVYLRRLFDAWSSLPEDVRPRLVSPAIPIGQGTDRSDADGFTLNDHYDGNLREFLPDYLLPHLDAIAGHTYPLRGTSKGPVWDKSKVEECIEKGLYIGQVRDILAPNARALVTEFGCPFDWDNNFGFYRACADRWAGSIQGAYAYSLQTIRGGEHFERSYLTVPSEAVTNSAYSLLVPKVDARA